LTELDKGVAHFTLFTRDDNPIVERLAFINLHKPTLAPSINLSKRNGTVEFGPMTQQGIYAASLIDNRFVSNAENIESYMYLSSDLKGHIEDAASYFNPEEAYNVRNYKLDLLMLTQGWRRFNWDHLEKVAPIKYYPEFRGFTIPIETAKGAYDRKKVEANVSLAYLKENVVLEGRTDAQGKFEFRDLNIQDSTNIYITASYGTGVKQKQNGKLKAKQDPIYIEEVASQIPFTAVIGSLGDNNKFNNALKEDLELKYGFNDIIIEDVIVTVKANKKKPFRRGALYSTPDKRVYSDSLGSGITTPFQLLQGIPGVTVGGYPGHETLTIRGGLHSLNGGNNPLVLLDGQQIDVAEINTLNAQDIEFVDVIKGAAGATYGSRGTNGVIAFYSKLGENGKVLENKLGRTTIFHPGYYKAQEFYIPKYDVATSTLPYQIVPTLVWQPNLNATESNKLEFTAPVYDGSFIVKVEGITQDGQPIVGTYSLE